MKTTLVLYVHGRGGSAQEAERLRPVFPDCEVAGLEYHDGPPWETGEEIRQAILNKRGCGDRILLIANSIGAHYCLYAHIDDLIQRACFISPIVDMEGLITGMMAQADVTEEELCRRQSIVTPSGEELFWDYLCYVRETPVQWDVPTEILYAGRDQLTSFEAVSAFVRKHHAGLTVMEQGEHWFHTREQLRFLDEWLKRLREQQEQ